MKKIIFILIFVILLGFGFYFFKFSPIKNLDNKNKFIFWTIQLKPIYEKEINTLIKDFEERHENLRVVWIDIPIAEAQKRTLASILSSTPPDLINLNPEFSVILAQKNALEFFTEEETSQYVPSLVDKLRYDGKIYALPFYATSAVTIYNKKAFDKCGMKPPKTYDELFSISKKLKACGYVAYASNINENDTLAKVLNKYDINSINNEIQKNKTVEIYSKYNDMYKNNYMPQDTLSINHREMVEKYMSNGAILIVAGSNFVNMIKKNAFDIYKESALSNQLIGSNKKYDVSLMNLVIPARAKNKELAKEFAFLLTNKDNQLQLSKLTNVLPANKYALNDNYFKNCPDDLVEQSRCISSKQLNNLNTVTFGENNKKTINEAINKALEEILLNNADIKKTVDTLSKELQALQN